MENTAKLVNALEYIAIGYDNTARVAIKNDDHIYVPADITEEELMQLIAFPQSLTSSNSGSEPCYASLDDANKGKNLDKSAHNGYVVIDPMSREVIDLVSRDGNSRLSSVRPKSKDTGLVRHLDGHKFGIGITSDMRGLKSEAGNYLIVEFKKNDDFKIYSSVKCRCPCLDADIFPNKESADMKVCDLENMENGKDYSPEKIDDDFIVDYGLHKKGYNPDIVHDLGVQLRDEANKAGQDYIDVVGRMPDKR